MKKLFVVMFLLIMFSPLIEAKDAHALAKSAKAAARSAKFAASLSPAKAGKLASYPLRHPIKAIKAVF